MISSTPLKAFFIAWEVSFGTLVVGDLLNHTAANSGEAATSPALKVQPTVKLSLLPKLYMLWHGTSTSISTKSGTAVMGRGLALAVMATASLRVAQKPLPVITNSTGMPLAMLTLSWPPALATKSHQRMGSGPLMRCLPSSRQWCSLGNFSWA